LSLFAEQEVLQLAQEILCDIQGGRLLNVMAYLYLERGVAVKRKGYPEPGLIRWGLMGGQVVFAQRGTPPPSTGSPFSPIDSNLNERRRVRFESTLAAYVLMDPSCVRPAVNEVSKGLMDYLKQMSDKKGKVAQKYDALGREIKETVYNAGYFGRLGEVDDAPRDSEILGTVREAVLNGSLQQIMNLHAVFSFKVVPYLGWTNVVEHAIWNRWTNELSQHKTLFAGDRGRKYRHEDKRKGPAVSTVGYTALEDPEVASFVEEHPRALEEYERLNPVPGSEPFIASLSSSTAELIRVGKVFCPRMQGELLKQYALACVAFLTGGGHHSFHEVMQVAALGGLPYTRGRYDFVLPESFKDTAWYDLLIEDYPDVLFTEYDSPISAYRHLDNV
jgi:hypothetical protein